MPSPEDIDAAVEAWFSIPEYMIYSYQNIPSCELLQCTRFCSDVQYILQLVLFFSILLWVIDKWQNWKLYWKREVILRYTKNLLSARCPKPLKTHWAHESRRFTIFVSWISFAPGIPRMQTWHLRACPGHALHAYIFCFGSTWHTVSVTTRLRNINRLISWRR